MWTVETSTSKASARVVANAFPFSAEAPTATITTEGVGSLGPVIGFLPGVERDKYGRDVRELGVVVEQCLLMVQGESDNDSISVFLLDDHEIVRKGVGDLVNAEPDMHVVGEAGGFVEALEVVARVTPDVAVLDVRLGDGNGIEVCRQIRSDHPTVACLILTSFADDQALIDAAMAGAAGYVLKQIRGNDLVDSIRKVAGGAQLLDSAAVRLGMQRLKDSDEGRLTELTPQEMRIFDLIGEGYSNRQIADQLFLAEKTVKNYVSALFSKLGMTRRTEAAALAARVDERHRRRYD